MANAFLYALNEIYQARRWARAWKWAARRALDTVECYREYEVLNAARIQALEEALRDMVRYDQWAETPGCDCRVCEVKRRARELLGETK